MNRKEEYKDLLAELEQTPPALAFTMTRVQARSKKRRFFRGLRTAAASLGGVLTAFVLLVNFSMPFALACVNLPLLKELMEAVAFSPSLKTMIKNDFIQPVDITKEADGASMTIHYLVYDGTELNIFYSADYNGSPEVEIRPDYFKADGSDLGRLQWSTGLPSEKGELGHLMMSIHSGEEFPETVKLKAELYPTRDYYRDADEPIPAPSASFGEWDDPDEIEREKEVPVAVLEFDLKLDPRFIKAKRVYEPHVEADLEGRTLIIEEVAVFPTGTRLVIREDENNDAELAGLEMWLEDGRGDRIGQGRNGLISSGLDEFRTNYWMNSVYFEPDDGLTLCIEKAQWLEKDKAVATLDLVNYEKSTLPEGLTLTDVERNGDNIRLTFRNEVYGGNFLSGWYDESGELRYFNQWGSHSLNEEDTSEPPFEDFTYIWNYTGDAVEVKLHWSEQVTYEEPIRIPLS